MRQMKSSIFHPSCPKIRPMLILPVVLLMEQAIIIVSEIYIETEQKRLSPPSLPSSFEIRNVKRHLGRRFCTVSFPPSPTH